MLSMRTVITLLLLLGSTLSWSGERAQQAEDNMVRARAHIISQTYCRGDADAFSVLFEVAIEVTNLSNSPVHLLWPLVPWVGKVASNLADAEAGKFLYEQTASHYPQAKTQFKRLTLEPGDKLRKATKYYLIVRRNPAFSLPKSVSPGTYALVLVLRPEEEPPAQMHGPNTLKTLTTEPFLVKIPSEPKLARCDVDATVVR